MRGGQISSGRPVSRWGAARRILARKAGGYTVIEILVVLGVTAGLFVAAAIMIAGRQNQTAFEQSIRQVQSQVQQILNEVSAGHYPARDNFQCNAGSPPIISAGSSGQGTNSGCIFLGRAIQFGVADTAPQQFSIYTIAGNQKSGGDEASSLSEAMPVVIAPSTPLHDNPGYPDISTDEILQSGIRVVRMWYNNGVSDEEIGALAFVNSLARFGDTGEIVSGAGSVNIVAIDGTSLDAAKLETVHLMNSDGGDLIASGTPNPSGGVFVCLDGGTDDYAIIQVGGENRELSVQLITKDKGGTTCTYP